MMLNYLERVELFVPQHPRNTHHGKHREYTYRDLVILRAINRLLEMGARPKRIAGALATFKKIHEIPETSDALLDFCRKSSAFIVGKNEVLYKVGNRSLINLNRNGQMELAFMIDIPGSLVPVANTIKAYLDGRSDRGSKDIALLNRIAKENGL